MKKTEIDWETIPKDPGVYFFKDGADILYIGKATSLRYRIRSYFMPDVATARGLRIVNMVIAAKTVEWRETESVLEALVLESELIKKVQPYFNAREKDDRSFAYVVITREAYPRILSVRGRALAATSDAEKPKYTFGPFPNGGELRIALKIIRRIFPYRDTCMPHAGKPCFNAQIGLCPGVCSGAITQAEYARTIRHIALFFRGKKRQIIKELERAMKKHASREAFEDAAVAQKQVTALRHINDVALMKRSEQGTFFTDSETASPFRIEAYDVAHLFGTSRVGAMTVTEDGVARPAEYRKFRLHVQNEIDDTGALAEILRRRLTHTEWRLPDLIVVDGSIAQRNRAGRVLAEEGVSIPVAAVTKDARHKAASILGQRALVEHHKDAILLANSESHRFAIRYHRDLRARKFGTKTKYGASRSDV